MSVDAPEQFCRRVDAVFGALDSIAQPSGEVGQLQPSGPLTTWSIARQQVYRAGREEADSSDADNDESAAHEPDHLMKIQLDAQDGNVQLDQQGNIIQPSLAFCQALDNEQEYDDVDAVAGTSLQGFADPADTKPKPSTEVLDDNVFDQRMRSHRAGLSTDNSSASHMDIDVHPSAPTTQQQGRLMQGWKAQQGLTGRPPLNGRRQGSGRGSSRVPHHVQHPEKYTCYILNEPLLVGGGDKASGINSQAQQEQAARAASSAALAAQQQAPSQEPTGPLPAFGSGIQFRPTKKAKPQASSGAAAAAAPKLMSHDADSDDDNEVEEKKALPVETSCMDDDFGERMQPSAHVKPRRRQYRVKSDMI